MERCDFSSISTCLKNQISESNQMNQPDFLYELFEDFMNDPINEDFSMDNGLICRWITGQAKISPKITSYYAKPSNQKKLATTIQRNLLPLMADCNMVIHEYSRAMKSHFRKFGNQMSGSGNHLCNYASLLA